MIHVLVMSFAAMFALAFVITGVAIVSFPSALDVTLPQDWKSEFHDRCGRAI